VSFHGAAAGVGQKLTPGNCDVKKQKRYRLGNKTFLRSRDIARKSQKS
jgi:hypothetical protein